MNIFKITLFLSLIYPLTIFSQDPEFTQFYSAPLYLNPSFAGSAGCSRVALNYRNEWPAISGTFVTFHLSYDQYVHPLRGGIGYDSWYDFAGEGTYSTYYNGLIYSPKFQLKNKISIAPAIKFGNIYKKIYWNSFSNPNYPEESTNSQLDISAGVLVHTVKLYVGFAVDHINQPKEGFIVVDNAKLPAILTFHSGYVYQRNEDSYFSFSPNIIYKKQQDFQQINIGLFINRGKITVGVWYKQAQKNSDTFIVAVGFQHRWIRFGYGYDITLSKLSNASAGSHEVSLRFLFNCKNKEDKIIQLTNIAF
ncbi:MAG: PorP/SprF family type IX secretion system membrane protein [Bacteroidota bacterium]